MSDEAPPLSTVTSTRKDEVIAAFAELSEKARIKLPSGSSLSPSNFRGNFHYVFYELNRRSNRHHIFRDKLIFDAVTSACGMNTPGNLGLFHKGSIRWFPRNVELSLRDFLTQEPGQYFVKGRDGAGGAGSFLLSVKDGKSFVNDQSLTEQEFSNRLSALSQSALIQRVIRQHPQMSLLNASSINTLRVITSFRKRDTRAKVMAIAIRIGRAGIVVDNAAAGGLFCHVDARSGSLRGPLRGKNAATYPCHPDSGRPLEGIIVPHFSTAVDQCQAMHEVLGPAPITIGWDIAISTDGPVFVEGNMYWDPTLHIADKDFPLRMAAEIIDAGAP